MRTTIKDVARETGVSIATVSLVLNGRECRVSKKTKEKILHAAESMNYRPNHLAVGLVTKKTHTVGLIVPDVSNVHFADMCKAIEQECKAKGFIVLLGCYGYSDDEAYKYFSVFIDKGVEGIIFAKPMVTDPSKLEEMCFKLAKNAKVPVITFEPTDTRYDAHVVRFDYQAGGYLGTKHLIDQGHRRIGCVTGPANIVNSIARVDGYRAALEEAGIEFDPKLLYEGDFNLESGQRALPFLLGQGVTAIFTFNDMMALGIYIAARNYRLKIPADLSVVGFDDSYLNEILEVPLTSVVHTATELGMASAQRVLKLINGEADDEEERIYRPTLNVRGSTRKL